MRHVHRVLSFVIILSLFIQPVFAEDLISEEVIPHVETVVESAPSGVLPEAPLQEDLHIKVEVAITTPEIPADILEVATDTEFISASIETPVLKKQMKTKIDTETPLPGSDYVAGEILVKYKDNKINLTKTAGRRAASQIAKSASLEKKDEMRESNISLLEITDTSTVEEKVEELEANQNVEYAQPNFIYTPSAIATDDPARSLLWGLDNTGQNVNSILGKQDADINAPQAWAINEVTNATITVAVIDTGVAYNHPDLLPNMWDGTNCKDEEGHDLGGCEHGYDYEDNDKIPLPTHSSHGTHIAGTIAAVRDNTKGIVGVAPFAKIMAIKTSLTTDEIVKSIHFASQNNAHIINASWVGQYEDPVLKSAIASFPGLFIAAAGNTSTNNESTHYYPSDFDVPNIISVAATDQNDGLAYFSNYGVTSIDVGAPGTNIFSTVAETVAFAEGFEGVIPSSTPSGWTKSGDQNSWGTYATGIPEWGNILYADGGHPYKDSASTTITSPTINLNGTGAAIDFWTVCDTEYVIGGGPDFMLLEYSSNGVDFTPMHWWDESTLDIDENPDNNDTGTILHFENTAIPAEYLTSNFKFQFRWHTDESDSNYYGCAVDAIHITKYSDGTDEQYGYMSGTSMATPHVVGLVALILGYMPSLSPEKVKDIILTTGDAVPSLATTTVSGKRINAYTALAYVKTLKTINTFTIPTQVGSTTLDEGTHTVTLTVPFGSNITSLTTSLTFSGSTTNPASGVAQDFTAPVTYTVNALDGTTQTYVVTVQIAAEIIPPPVIVPPSSGGGGGSSGGGGGGGGGGSSKSKVLINNGAQETRSRVVQLTITKVKDATQMQISNIADFGTLPWIPFASTYSWTLAPGNGSKTIYVRYGKNNKEVGAMKDTIIFRESNGGLTVQTLPQAQHTPTTGGTSKVPASLTKFVSTLSIGSKSQEVTELQKVLIAEGFLKVTPPTGYFGSITQLSVVAYQRAHGIPQTGIVDAATRAKLNGSVTTTPNDAQRVALIKVFQAKLLELIAELMKLKAH